MLHNVIIVLGSNSNSEKNISKTKQMLSDVFDIIYFAKPVPTIPIDIPNPNLFLNQVCILKTELNITEITAILKHIEHTIGRTPEDKLKHCITIDADLIKWEDTILKPKDLDRFYVQDGIREILKDNHLSL